MGGDFTKIRAWKLAHEFTLQVYGITKRFPERELFGLKSQLRRAASSIPANIAEGANRTSKREYLQFLSVASGSLAEARHFLHLSMQLGYVPRADYETAGNLAQDASKTLAGLIAAIKKEVQSRESEVGGRRSEERGRHSLRTNGSK
jgi:four helix bundle protein